MRRFVLLIVWFCVDALLFLGSYVLAYVVRVRQLNSTDFPLEQYVTTALIVIPVWLLVMLSLRVFALTRVQSSWRSMTYIFYAAVMGTALFALTHYFIYKMIFSRLLLVLAGAFSFIAVALWHMAFDQWQRRILRKDPPAYPTLIIGATREAERLIELLNTKQSVLTPVAILDSRGVSAKDVGGVPVKGKLDSLEETLKRDRITHLIQCADLEHTVNLLGACRSRGITYMLLPSVLGMVEGDERVDVLEGAMPVTVVSTSRGWPSVLQ